MMHRAEVTRDRKNLQRLCEKKRSNWDCSDCGTEGVEGCLQWFHSRNHCFEAELSPEGSQQKKCMHSPETYHFVRKV